MCTSDARAYGLGPSRATNTSTQGAQATQTSSPHTVFGGARSGAVYKAFDTVHMWQMHDSHDPTAAHTSRDDRIARHVSRHDLSWFGLILHDCGTARLWHDQTNQTAMNASGVQIQVGKVTWLQFEPLNSWWNALHDISYKIRGRELEAVHEDQKNSEGTLKSL